MKISQKGFVIPIIIAIVAVIALGGGYYYTQKQSAINDKKISSIIDETANWKLYTNTQYGYQVKYPNNWKIYSMSSSSVNLISPETEKKLKDYPSLPVRFNTIISIIPYFSRISGSDSVSVYKNDLIFNGIKAEQVTIKDEEGVNKYIYIDKNGITYQITAATNDIEEKILSTFNFITPTDETIGWKTYEDNVKGFSLKYPTNYEVFNNSVCMEEKNGQILKSTNDNILIEFIADEPGNYILVCYYPETLSKVVDKKTLSNIILDGKNAYFKNIGKGRDIYYLEKDTKSYFSLEIFYGLHSENPQIDDLTLDAKKMYDILSTFKLITPVTQIIYTDKINGYQLRLPASWIDYKVINSSFFLPTTVRDWCEEAGCGYAKVFSIIRYNTEDWNLEKNKCKLGLVEICLGEDSVITKNSTTVFVKGYSINSSPEVLGDERWGQIASEVSNINYLKNNFSIINSDEQNIIELNLWPNVNSFDFVNKTFEAKGVRDYNSIKKIKVYTDNSTKFSSKDMYTSMSDFKGMYTMMKDWVGPEWWFTVKGVYQKDGSFLANDISIAGQ